MSILDTISSQELVQKKEKLLLRKAQDQEPLVEVVRIIRDAFKRQGIARTDREVITSKQLKQCMRKHSELFILFEERAKPVGVFLLTVGRGFCSNLADIRFLAVHPEHQGRGLGKKLMSSAEREAQELHRCTRMLLTVAYHPDYPQDRLVSWYQSQGYEYIGDKQPSLTEKIEYIQRKYHRDVRWKIFGKELGERGAKFEEQRSLKSDLLGVVSK